MSHRRLNCIVGMTRMPVSVKFELMLVSGNAGRVPVVEQDAESLQGKQAHHHDHNRIPHRCHHRTTAYATPISSAEGVDSIDGANLERDIDRLATMATQAG